MRWDGNAYRLCWVPAEHRAHADAGLRPDHTRVDDRAVADGHAARNGHDGIFPAGVDDDAVLDRDARGVDMPLPHRHDLGNHQARAVAGGGPLEHLQVAVGVAEGEDRSAANHAVDTYRLAGAVIVMGDFGGADVAFVTESTGEKFQTLKVGIQSGIVRIWPC